MLSESQEDKCYLFEEILIIPQKKVINFVFRFNIFFSFTKTLGVPCAEKYPLNLMQLVLPKGKVEQPPKLFSFLKRVHSYG
jgi:hypothetical protein